MNSTLDEPDAFTDGLCVSAPSGVCTLRAAIEEINVSGSGNINVAAGTYTLTLGDLDITKSPTISGAGAGSTIIQGDGSARVFEIAAAGFAYIEKVTIRNGTGGVSTVFPGHIHGGGIHNHGTLILVDATVRDNTASSGGAITNAGTGVLTLVNVTITNNTASGGFGGGLENLGTATLENVTISHNSGASAGGISGGGSMTLVNTIVANNGATNCSGPAEAPGSASNLDSANTCGFAAAGDKINQDPLLGALAPDGTRPLGVGSPAIDAGDSSAANCPSTDERGVSRPQDGDGNGSALCDMGAYEVASAVVDSADLTISPQGAGSGNIVGQGSVGGAGIIDCDWNGTVKTGTCFYASGGLQSIQLVATASAGSTFFGWTNCPGTVSGTGGNICTYSITTVTDDFDIQPKFDLAANTLTVTKTGTGTGTVTSVDGNINCGPTCAHGYAPGAAVTLNAAAAAGSTFVQWLGACAGTPANQPCLLTMTAALTATAQFDQAPQFSLSVTTSGTGTGTVTSSPAGIGCPPTCTAAFQQGTVVTLTPSPGPNSRFKRWTGACTGTGACTITINAAASVNAEFANTQVKAGVLGAGFLKKNGKRYARVKINANEEVDVQIRVIKNGRTRAAKNVNNFGPGTGTVQLKLGKGVPGGSARIQIILTDNDGNTKTVNRTRSIPNK